LLTVVEEFGVCAGPLAPVVQAFDEQSVTVLELDDLLEFDWHFLYIEEEVHAKLVTFRLSVLVQVVQLHLDGVLDVEFLNGEVVLVEDESWETDDRAKMQLLLGEDI